VGITVEGITEEEETMASPIMDCLQSVGRKVLNVRNAEQSILAMRASASSAGPRWHLRLVSRAARSSERALSSARTVESKHSDGRSLTIQSRGTIIVPIMVPLSRALGPTMQLPRMDSIDYLLLGFVVLCLFQVASGIYKYRSVDSWVRTDARPVESGPITQGQGYRNGKMPVFQFETVAVKYEYWVNQVKYTGHTLRNHSSSPMLAYSFDVFYNPEKPGMSVVEKHLPWGSITVWLAGLLASASTLYGWRIFKKKNESPNK
tara:strand:+ start:553 stop:1338 length:786 start_codon:yes stop_codon:yes gene_type:complete